MFSAWGLKWDRAGGSGARSVWGPSVALPVTQGAVKRVVHLSAFVPLICLSGRDKAGRGDACLCCCQTLASVRRPLICPLSLLHDWSFCHYFLAAGGNSGNLVNPLTTNCPLLPYCLNQQNAGGGSRPPPRDYKRQGEKAGSHCRCPDPGGPGGLLLFSRCDSMSEMSGKVSLLCLCFCVSLAEAHIWAWMLNMPHRPPKDGAGSLREHPPVARAATVRCYWILNHNCDASEKRKDNKKTSLLRCYMDSQTVCIGLIFDLFPSRLCVTTKGPAGGVSRAIDTSACAFLSEGRATTVGGMPSACVASAACSGSATAAFPADRKVKTHNPKVAFVRLGNEHQTDVSYVQVPDVKWTGTANRPCAALATTASGCARDAWSAA